MSGHISLKLRPIKLAFLVEPSDKAALQEAIQINSFLWGGVYNPIIPCFKRVPRNWQDRLFKNPSPREIIKGYLDTFDPDFVVPLGSCANRTFDVGNREIVAGTDILSSVKVDGAPNYGVGLFELLRHLHENEFKFVRKEPLVITLPKFSRSHELFLSSVLGALPDQINQIFWDHFAEGVEAKKEDCSTSDFYKFLTPKTLFLRRITSLFIKPSRPKWPFGDCIFYLDASKNLDIIDYWNLRAIGWRVIPIPRQATLSEGLRDFLVGIIESNYGPMRFNPDIYNFTTILKSRFISEEAALGFSQSLNLSKPEKTESTKIVLQSWYPSMWDEWAKDKDGVVCCELKSLESQHEFDSIQERVRAQVLPPKFIEETYFSGKPRFANEVEMRFYGNETLLAEVIPEGGKDLAWTIGGFEENWRFSKKGLIYLASSVNFPINISLPKAGEVFVSWLRSLGWTASLSSPGKIASQMLAQLSKAIDVKYGLNYLANEGLIKLLSEKMSQGRPLNKDAFIGAIKKIANQGKGGRLWEYSTAIHYLTEMQVFRLGLEIQCSTCSMNSWYSIKDADYELQCPHCLGDFSIRSRPPADLKWSYRTFGPFSLPYQAMGVYAVLLTLRFFSSHSLLDGATTPVMSFEAKKDGLNIEADLGLFFQSSRLWKGKVETIFAECKTYNEFEKRDIERMETLAANFRGAVLVFSTLRKELTSNEKTMLRAFVNKGRKNYKAEKPNNPVIILTGTELFASGRPPKCWEDARLTIPSPYNSFFIPELVKLSDATQQLHLGMESWDTWLHKDYEKKRERSISRKEKKQN